MCGKPKLELLLQILPCFADVLLNSYSGLVTEVKSKKNNVHGLCIMLCLCMVSSRFVNVASFCFLILHVSSFLVFVNFLEKNLLSYFIWYYFLSSIISDENCSFHLIIIYSQFAIHSI